MPPERDVPPPAPPASRRPHAWQPEVRETRAQPGCHVRSDRPRSALPDEVHGAQAAGALLAGDFDGATDALERVSWRYLAGFLLRLGLLRPSVSARLAFRLATRRLAGTASQVGSTGAQLPVASSRRTRSCDRPPGSPFEPFGAPGVPAVSRMPVCPLLHALRVAHPSRSVLAGAYGAAPRALCATSSTSIKESRRLRPDDPGE